jgi:plastocyanin
VPQARTIGISGSGRSFTPSGISAQQGELVQFSFNGGGHTFTIDALGVNISGSGSQQVTLSQAGTFTFYCAVGSHRADGMEGTLNVSQ